MSASCSARSALMVSKSGSPGPAPTSVTLPSTWPGAGAPAKADGSAISFSARFSFIAAAGENQRADRAIDHALPEPAAQRKLGNAAMDRFAPAADERGEIADPRRQDGFDALAHAARHHRRGAAGADRDHHVAAIDDGRKNESRMRKIVHHIDGQADRFRPRRHRDADVAGARTQDRNHAAQIGDQRIAFGQLDPRGIGGVQPAHIMTAVGGEPADARARRQQQAQFRPRQIRRTRRAGSDRSEDREIPAEIACDTRSPDFRG